jgi:beta-glucosidase
MTKNKKGFNPKKFIVVRSIVFACILAFVITASVIVGYWNTAITMYFQGAGADYSSDEAVKAHDNGVAVSEKIESEGIVLLKNENEALPLAKNAKVSVFGYDAIDFYYGGAGSGSGSGATSPTTFEQALSNAGFSVNSEILNMYKNSDSTRGKISMGGSNYSIGEIPASKYSSSLIENAKKNFGDAAIVVIGRSGAEGEDVCLDMSQYESGNYGHYLELNQDEKDMLALANSNFNKVIVVINAPSAMELGFLVDGTYPNIKGAIWVGQPGSYGMNAIGQVLSGEINPSGHLVDTYAYDLTQDPTYSNFGNFEYSDADGYYFVNYNEGVYVGYRYYETRYEDVVMNTANVGSFDYNSSVVFPFGFGLSYTKFAWSNYSVTEKEDTFTVSVTIKNEGSMPGKDVIEVYMQKPYTEYDKQYGIEKPAVELVGFTKTSLLEAGEEKTFTVDIAKERMKSYDSRGVGSYIVEAGTYYLTAASNAHTAVNNILKAKKYSVANGMTADGNESFVADFTVASMDSETYSKDLKTGTAITNQFEGAERNLTYLSRKDWTGTFPSADKVNYEAGAIKDSFDYQITDDGITIETVEWEQDNGLTLSDMVGKDYDDPDWDKLISQMSKQEMKGLLLAAGWKTNKVESIGKPKTLDLDGPSGYSEFYSSSGLGGAQYPVEVVIASTWNTELAYEVGDAIGKEGTAYGISGWYGPAMNIHRSPFAGRNFEYYSEDGFISGKMGANEVKGAWDNGVYAYIKHFALNDQETNRSAKGLMTWANEQTIREIYLLPFELSVKEGNAKAVMSSFNRIGYIWSGGHKGLLTNVLRGEWGFVGFVLTDAVQSTHMVTSQGIRAGNDAWLSVAVTALTTNDEHSAYTWTCIKHSVHNMLYVIANSNCLTSTKGENGFPTWAIIYIIAASALVVGDVAFGTVSVKEYLKKKKEINNQ